MSERVKSQSEISLNAVLYPIVGGVQATLVSVYPGKVVQGDTTRDSQQRLSVHSKSDWRGGIGVEVEEGSFGIDRTWWSTGNLRHIRHLTHGPLATTTAASGVSSVYTIGPMGELANEIYVPFGTDVRKYDNVADSWGSSLHTLAAEATDALTMRMLDGTVYMIWAHTSGYTYTSNGSSFTADTEDILYMASWDDRLWGIDNTGQLRYSLAIGTWTDDAQLPLPDSSVTDLFVARDAVGEPILFVMTTVGLFAHDAGNTKFVETEFGLPLHPDNGVGTNRFRSATYIPAGLGVHKYQDGSSPAVITLVGPDRDDGVPADRRGTIKQLVAGHNENFAAVDATTAQAINMFATSGMAAHGAGALPSSNVISPSVGFSYILGWDEVGWQVKWLSAVSDSPIDAMKTSNTYGFYRLWWGSNRRILYMDLPRDIVNPRQATDYRYASAMRHEDPWFDAGQAEVDKIVIRRKVEVTGSSSSETITPYYRVNYDTTWTAQTAITDDGVTTYDFPNSTTPAGTGFRAIQLRLDGARGTDNTNAPAVVSDTIEYRKKLTVRRGYSVTVQIPEERYKGKTPNQLREALVTAIGSNPLVEFTYRDDDGDTRNFFVDVMQAQDLEETGHDEAGTSRLLLVET